MELTLTWAEIKTALAQFDFLIQYLELDLSYQLWTTDGTMPFACRIQKLDDEGAKTADCIDFEDNYKADCNKIKYGRQMVQSTARPEGTTSYFTGAGDDPTNGIGEGNQLLFDMTDQDASVAKDVSFSETVWFKDGQIWCDESTPFGSYMDTEIIHPQAGVVGSFGRKIFLFPGWQPLDTEDRGEIPYGLSVRLTVHNADTKVAFKCIGRLEIYRETQV